MVVEVVVINAQAVVTNTQAVVTDIQSVVMNAQAVRTENRRIAKNPIAMVEISVDFTESEYLWCRAN